MWIRYNYRYSFCFLSIVVLQQKFLCFAQKQEKDSLIRLQEVEIKDYSLQVSEKFRKSFIIDTLLIESNPLSTLGEILNQHSEIFIKNYGPSMLSVPSLRGTSAGHTPVVWDGVNLQDPMNGQIDLNLLPAYFFDNISIYYGGDGALLGNAVTSGMISLGTSDGKNIGLTLNLCNSIGSFGKIHSGAGVLFRDPKSQINFKVLKQYAENNYPFPEKISTGTILKPMTNSKSNLYGAMAEYAFFINSYNQIKLSYLNLYSNKQIPPAVTIPQSDASQNDQINLSKMEWRKQKTKNRFSLRTAWINTSISYNEPSAEISSSNLTNGIILDFDYQKTFSTHHSLSGGTSYSFSKAKTLNYDTDKNRKIVSLFGSYIYTGLNGKLTGVGSLRYETYQFRKQQFLPSLGSKTTIVPSLSIKVNIARHYRYPTLNDLYWFQGGNPFLQPEYGWNKEIQLQYDKNYQKVSCIIKPGYFHNKIYNWIIWLPAGYYWSPRNLKTVNAQGVEIDFTIGYKFTSFSSLNLNSKYSYIRSVNETSSGPNDNSTNKQLIYVPENRWINDFVWAYKYFSLLINTTFTGLRYTTTDNSEYLESFMLLNLRLMYAFEFKNFSTRLFGAVNNLLNVQYAVIPGRPLPLQNYECGVNMDLNFYKIK